MKRLVTNILLIIPAVVLSLSVGCTPKEEISVEVVDCLMRMNIAALDEIDSELEKINQQLYEVELKLLKLEQVVTPALVWTEYQAGKEMQQGTTSSWSIRVPSEELAEFKNDQYQVTTLQLTALEVGTPDQQFSSVIKVTDLTTKTTCDWEAVASELELRKSTLERRMQAKLEKRQLSTSTFLEVISYWEDWEIEEISSNTYSVNGPGLGWAEELTTGKWTYYRDSGEIIPADSQCVALHKILLIEF